MLNIQYYIQATMVQYHCSFEAKHDLKGLLE